MVFGTSAPLAFVFLVKVRAGVLNTVWFPDMAFTRLLSATFCLGTVRLGVSSG